ncbi:Hypothetical predicted protein, partial [Cloeon dipterum]
AKNSYNQESVKYPA